MTIDVEMPKIDGYDKWDLEQAVRTLEEAEEIKADKKKMKALGPFIKRKKQAINNLDDLREMATSKVNEDNED